jgi:hypothetical protein
VVIGEALHGLEVVDRLEPDDAARRVNRATDRDHEWVPLPISNHARAKTAATRSADANLDLSDDLILAVTGGHSVVLGTLSNYQEVCKIVSQTIDNRRCELCLLTT